MRDVMRSALCEEFASAVADGTFSDKVLYNTMFKPALSSCDAYIAFYPHARDTFASGLAKVLLRRQVGQCARIFLQLVPLFLVFLIHLAVRSKIAMSAHTRVCARAQPQLHVNAMCPGWCKSDMAGNHASSLASADRTRFNAIVCAGWERPPKTAAEGADTVRALQLHQRVYCWRWP